MTNTSSSKQLLRMVQRFATKLRPVVLFKVEVLTLKHEKVSNPPEGRHRSPALHAVSWSSFWPSAWLISSQAHLWEIGFESQEDCYFVRSQPSQGFSPLSAWLLVSQPELSPSSSSAFWKSLWKPESWIPLCQSVFFKGNYVYHWTIQTNKLI